MRNLKKSLNFLFYFSLFILIWTLILHSLCFNQCNKSGMRVVDCIYVCRHCQHSATTIKQRCNNVENWKISERPRTKTQFTATWNQTPTHLSHIRKVSLGKEQQWKKMTRKKFADIKYTYTRLLATPRGYRDHIKRPTGNELSPTKKYTSKTIQYVFKFKIKINRYTK